MTLNIADIDLTIMVDLIRESGRPVHINMLTREAADVWRKQQAQKRTYAPGAFYKVNETVEFDGRSATITEIQSGHNSKQGHFQILTLTFADGSQKQMASGIKGAPADDRGQNIPEPKEEYADDVLLEWRTAVQDKLTIDNRFVHFQDEQGDQWCLAELLPTISDDELRQIWPAFQKTTHDLYATVSTDNLVAAIWGFEDDGGDEFPLFAFALNSALQEYRDLQYVAGGGWMLAEHWRKIEERPSLVGPRKANIVPAATDEEEYEETHPQEIEHPTEKEEGLALDIELWRSRRINEVLFILKASHYYYHWLPLSRRMQRLFPPRACQVTIYFHFEGQEYPLTAVVNPEQKRILFERAMHDKFHDIGIYPGAKLIISRRSTEYAYDLRTRPVEGKQSVTVRRIFLDDNKQLEYADDEELLRYQVDGDLFVAGARWEDLALLFQQADEAGKGIFTLMFEKCQEWQYERGTSLMVTAKELFKAIHFDDNSRMTSIATIAYELWRRLAFSSAGNGQYQFHPEKGSNRRSHGLSVQKTHTPSLLVASRKGKSKSLTLVEKRLYLPQVSETDLAPIGPLFEETDYKEDSGPTPTGYFIFQQKPVSEYDDQTGRVYNWRQGIPGSKQIDIGARFIYYRPGEQLFFGSGRIDSIDIRKDKDGRDIYDGQISDYKPWKPPLPLTRSLANQLSFIKPERLWVGQAGIRKISAEDYQTICKIYRRRPDDTKIDNDDYALGTKAVTEERVSLFDDEFARMCELIQANLIGEVIVTPSGMPNVITNITSSGLMVATSKGESEVTWEWIRQVANKLYELGAIERNTIQKGPHRVTGGYRSALIFGLLARFKHISAESKPRTRLVYHPPGNSITLLPVGFSPDGSTSKKATINESWTEEKTISQFKSLQVWRSGKKVARFKPILLLYALAKCSQGFSRLLLYSDVKQDLAELLARFDPDVKVNNLVYRFRRFHNDELWDIPNAEIFPYQSSSHKRIDSLLHLKMKGGFPSPLFDTLLKNPTLIEKVAAILLDQYIPLAQHPAIRDAVGLSTPTERVYQDSSSSEPHEPEQFFAEE